MPSTRIIRNVIPIHMKAFLSGLMIVPWACDRPRRVDRQNVADEADTGVVCTDGGQDVRIPLST